MVPASTGGRSAVGYQRTRVLEGVWIWRLRNSARQARLVLPSHRLRCRQG